MSNYDTITDRVMYDHCIEHKDDFSSTDLEYLKSIKDDIDKECLIEAPRLNLIYIYNRIK